MENKINVVVAERSYTLTTADDAEYVEKVAEFVNTQVNQLSEASHASTLDAAIMAALNIADGYFKAQETAENLRNSLNLIGDSEAPVAIVTNNFHVWRAVHLAEKAGFHAYVRGEKLKAGDKIYHVNRGKSVFLAVIGS